MRHSNKEIVHEKLDYEKATLDDITCQKRERGKKIWTKEEDSLLLKLAKEHENLFPKWDFISKFFIDKSNSQCYNRYKMIDPDKQKGKWTNEEKLMVEKLADRFGNKFSKIAKNLGSRTSKQVREFLQNRPPKKRIFFTTEEDEIIIDYYKKHGPKWSLISNSLEDRKAGQIRNRFYTKLKAFVTLEKRKRKKKDNGASDQKKFDRILRKKIIKTKKRNSNNLNRTKYGSDKEDKRTQFASQNKRMKHKKAATYQTISEDFNIRGENSTGENVGKDVFKLDDYFVFEHVNKPREYEGP